MEGVEGGGGGGGPGVVRGEKTLLIFRVHVQGL